MKEIRITFGEQAFAAVSKSLIDLGVYFRVEPLEGGDAVASPAARSEATANSARSRQSKTRPTKGGGAKGASSVQGAERLREIAERNRAGSGERDLHVAGAATVPEDLSARLLSYAERQDK